MKQILCTNPNATSPINGIDFFPVDGGLMSGPIDDGVAGQFDGIPLYTVMDAEPPEKTAKKL